jgi:hypothetical protein
VKSRLARILGAASAVTGLVLLVSGAAFSQDENPPNLEGVWSGPTQMLDDEAWAFEDFACFLGCPSETFAYARTLFSDPRNYDRSYPELQGAVIRRRVQDIVAKLTPTALELRQTFDPADDPAIGCQPYGLVRQALSPVPIEFTRTDDAVTIRYELWGAVRKVFLDDRTAGSGEPTRLGHSVGRYEDGTFVVETTGIRGDVIAADARVLHGDKLRATERYTLTEHGNRLDLELTLIDPSTLTEPLTLRTAWRRTPAAPIFPYECSLIGNRP